ncbi:uncharacterized protein PG998_002630 [Apiospora kogelbergensis]|uniref:uncharacterized protein n=1 Tax=Apiospora kogelbergensis TaxID=1337665 RepID=UPI003130D3D5
MHQLHVGVHGDPLAPLGEATIACFQILLVLSTKWLDRRQRRKAMSLDCCIVTPRLARSWSSKAHLKHPTIPASVFSLDASQQCSLLSSSIFSFTSYLRTDSKSTSAPASLRTFTTHSLCSRTRPSVMDNSQFSSCSSYVPNGDQEDWSAFFDFSSALDEPLPEYVPERSGYLPEMPGPMTTVGDQAADPSSFQSTLWNPYLQPQWGSIGSEPSFRPTPDPLVDMDCSLSVFFPPCDLGGISLNDALPKAPAASNYGYLIGTNVFEQNSGASDQSEMAAFDGQEKQQSTTDDQDVFRSSSPSPLQDLRCALDRCSKSFVSIDSFQQHQRFHTKAHWVANESPFRCGCAQEFVTLYTLQRHIGNFQKLPGFSCEETDCSKAFQRKDHLKQHLSHKHHYSDAELEAKFPTRQVITNIIPVCHFESCTYYRDASFGAQPLQFQEENKPFIKQADYTKHMKDVHEWSPFPCNLPSCDKREKKGYFSRKALQKHRKEKHPEAEEESPAVEPRKKFPCGLPGCHKRLRLASLTTHRTECRRRLSKEQRATYPRGYDRE